MPTLARRYAPFLAIVALQLVLVTLAPAGRETVTVSQPSASAVGTSAAGSAAVPSVERPDAPPAVTATTVSVSAGTPGRRATTVTSAATAGQLEQRVATASPSGEDRSKCAPGGLLQENVTVHSPQCVPKFAGDNGGATYQGVTADGITIVAAHPRRQAGVQQALQAGGLSASDAQWEDVVPLIGDFFNRHYELYGRKIKTANFWTSCVDAPCWRADAKAVNAKFHPFAVVWEGDYTAPEPFIDQLTELGVMVNGVPGLSDAWFKAHAPLAWGIFPQAERQADMLADYYCKKMYGQNATHAGDPTMRVKKRKVGIVTSEDPAVVNVAERFRQKITGGFCGSDSDGTTVYTFSADTTTAQNQQAALVTRLKNDGITTKTTIGFVQLETESDKQQYFPENLVSLPNDADIVGRLYQALGSPNQMRNTFGVGFLEKSQPLPEQDFQKAIHDVNPQYDPPRISQATFVGFSLYALLMQWAGPKLTPATIEAGARKSVQIGGWTNPKPWPGWKCCNPHVNEYRFGADPSSFTAKVDAKEEYWDGQAISEDDNQPGAWVCADPNCRRYEVGQWPKGVALQA